MQKDLGKRIILLLSLVSVFIISIIPIETPIAQNSDKTGHFIAYFILCLVVYLNGVNLGRAFILVVIYGIVIEAIQYFLPYRSFSFPDMVANSLGAGLFVIAHQFISHFRKR
jgi:VanZ family protein